MARITILIALLLAVNVLEAQDFSGNTCFEEGANCGDGSTPESQHAWTCGWYNAAANEGVISRDQIPESCRGGGRSSEEEQNSRNQEPQDRSMTPNGPVMTVC